MYHANGSLNFGLSRDECSGYCSVGELQSVLHKSLNIVYTLTTYREAEATAVNLSAPCALYV